MKISHNKEFYSDAIKEIKVELHQKFLPAVDVLAERFFGASALVISAGPSAKYWRDVYNSLPKPILVICIKQAIELRGLQELCDMHFCNTWNLKRYNYKNANVLRFFSSAISDPPSLQSWDIRFNIDRGNGGLETSLAATLNFEKWTLANQGLNRPWGPGVMYETVLFSLIHMGIKSIYTVGWDVANSDGANSHFYDEGQSRSSGSRKVVKISRVRSFISKLGGHQILQYIRFLQGKKYNVCGMLPGEAALVAKSLPVLNEWISSYDTRIICFTESKWFPSKMLRPLPKLSDEN